MRARRPATVRTDVVVRAMLAVTGTGIPDFADALVPDAVLPGWMEIGHSGAVSGMPPIDLVPTPGTPTLGNADLRIGGAVHLFSSEWSNEGSLTEMPCVIVTGTLPPDTVLEAAAGRPLSDLVSLPCGIARLGGAVIRSVWPPDDPTGGPAVVIELEPDWIDQSTREDA